jgi:beta-methylmalyl-CoA/(S)-malyl-CoA lyase
MRLCRTFQTAPAAVTREDSAKYLRSGLTAEGFATPDWLVPDLEDGTAPDAKAEGLENVVDLLPEYAGGFGGEVWPRVEWSYDDERRRERGREQVHRLLADVGEYLDGIVVPKVGRLASVEGAATALADAEREAGLPEGAVELAVIVETARARSDLREIGRFGADSRLSALVFGPVDYTAELGGREQDGERPEWPGLLEALSNEASANGLLAVGGPFDRLFRERAGVTFYNGDAYADRVEQEAHLGLDGSWSLHPSQTEQANRVHMPGEADLRRDVERIEAFEEAKAGGTGAAMVDGQMVDEATFRNFANTVDTAATIHEQVPGQAEAAYPAELLERALSLDTSW